jgi:polyphenol oxidase
LIEPRTSTPRESMRAGRTWLTYPELDAPNLIHGIVVFKELHPGTPHEEWMKTASEYFAKEIGLPLIVPRQIHGKEVWVIRLPHLNVIGDGLVTDQPGVIVGVSVADCIPLLAANAASGVVGVAHCGWRGIAAGIVEGLATELDNLTDDPESTTYVIGAGIGACCYEVRNDLLREFAPAEVDRFSKKRAGGTFFDLKQTIASRLQKQGTDPTKISIDMTCTSCQKYKLSSFRAESTRCGRMLAVLALSGAGS